MSVLFSKKEADAEVIETLLKIIRRLTPMALLQLVDGSVIRVEEYQVVTTEELQSELAHAQERVNELQAFVPAPVVNTVPVTEPVAPFEPTVTPVDTTVATDPNTTTTVPVDVATPVVTETPVLQ